MRILWSLTLVSLSVIAQTAPSLSIPSSEPKSLSEGDLAVDPYAFYGNDTSTDSNVSHTPSDSGPVYTSTLNEIGEHAPPAQTIVVPPPATVKFGPVNPLPELRPALPMPLVDSFTKFQQDVQKNVTTLQQNAQKTVKNIQRGIQDLPKFLVVQGSELQKNLQKLFQKAQGRLRQPEGPRHCYAGFKALSAKSGFGRDKLNGGYAIEAIDELARQKFVPVWGRMLKSNLNFPPNLSKLQPGAVLVYASPTRTGRPGHIEWKVQIGNEHYYASDYKSRDPGGRIGNKLIAIYYPPGAKLEAPLGVVEKGT